MQQTVVCGGSGGDNYNGKNNGNLEVKKEPEFGDKIVQMDIKSKAKIEQGARTDGFYSGGDNNAEEEQTVGRAVPDEVRRMDEARWPDEFGRTKDTASFKSCEEAGRETSGRGRTDEFYGGGGNGAEEEQAVRSVGRSRSVGGLGKWQQQHRRRWLEARVSRSGIERH